MTSSESDLPAGWPRSDDGEPDDNVSSPGGCAWMQSSSSDASSPGADDHHRARGRGRGRGRGRPKCAMRQAVLAQRAERRIERERKRMREDAAAAIVPQRPGWIDHLRPVGGQLSATFVDTCKRDGDGGQLSGVAAAVFERANDPAKPRPLLPVKAETYAMGFQNHDYVKSVFELVGASVYFASRSNAGSFCSWMYQQTSEDGPLDPVCVFRCLGQDESTFRLLADRTERAAAGSKKRRPAHDPGQALQAIVPVTEPAVNTEHAVSKVMQSEFVLAFLVQDRQSGRFGLYFMELPTPLLQSDKGTAEELFDGLHGICNIPFLKEVMRRFSLIDLSNSDRGAPGLKCDKLFEMKYPGVPRLWGLGCVTHKVNSSQKAQYATLGDTIPGAIAWNVHLQASGKPKALRAILQDTLMRRAKPRPGLLPPPASDPAIERIRAILRLHLDPESYADEMRFTRLSNLLHSDPDDESRIVVYLPHLEADAPIPVVANHVMHWARLVSEDLAPPQNKAFQRGRWVLNLKPLRGPAMLSAMYNLLPAVGVRLCQAGAKQKVELPVLCDDVPAASAGRVPKSIDKEQDKAAYWAEKNEKARGDALRFSTSPHTRMSLLLAMLVLPRHVHLLVRVLPVGSEAWDEEQWVDALQANSPERKYRILMGHNGELTSRFHDECVLFLDDRDVWSLVPAAARTLRTRGMATALVVRGLGAITYYVDEPFDGCPAILFELIDPTKDLDQVAYKLAHMPKCVKDPFAYAFFALFSTEDQLKSGRCRAILVALALLARLCISRIECRNAFIRRLLSARTTTWFQELANVSSDWVLMRQRLIELTSRYLPAGVKKR